MADFERDPNEARDPEYEYAFSQYHGEEGSYRTGSTTPPKDYGWVLTIMLVTMVFFGGINTAMGALNIKLFESNTVARQDEDIPVTFVAGTTVTTGLESGQSSAQTEVTTPMVSGGAVLQINDSPESVANFSQEGTLSWQQVYKKVINSVVSITCTSGSTTTSGTGVVMTHDGYIITNAHVVEGADSISVLLTDGRTFTGTPVGIDGVSDLAVLVVEADDLTAAEFGDSASLQVGDGVVAIGDPLGAELRGTMTDGIISGINRDITAGGRTMSLIQTTAALNEGNSGGPLVNCYGQVVGINTMKIGDYASNSGVEGLGFAIPTSTVKEVVDQLIEKGYVAGRPTLGLSGEMVSNFYQYYYRLPSGFMITSIDPSSDAAAKGLQTGDIILYAAGRDIDSTSDMSEVVNSCQIGDVITIILYRGGFEYSVELTVTEATE